jgi:nicotinamidase-related amidase
VSADPHTAPHWGSSALVLIDVQNDFLTESPYGIPGTTAVLPALRELCEAFRAARRPIVHIIRLYLPDGSNADISRRTLIASGAAIVNPGTAGRDIAEGLLPAGAPQIDDTQLLSGKPQALGSNEYAVFKPRWGAFYQTPLQELLTEHGVDTIVFAGCNLPNCPRASIIEASERDYRTVLASDAVSNSTAQGLQEISGIGTQLIPTAGIITALSKASQ